MKSLLQKKHECAHLEVCGNCEVRKGQSYSNFLDEKQKSLESIEKLYPPGVKLHSPQLLSSFRRVVQWRGRLQRDQIRLGYFKSDSRVFFQVDTCPILTNKLSEVLNIRHWSKEAGSAPMKFRLIAQEIGDSTVLTLKPGDNRDSEIWHELADFYQSQGYECFLEQNTTNKYFQSENGLYFGPTQFMQSHNEAEERLKQSVWEWLQLWNVEGFADLFCGNGVYSEKWSHKTMGYDFSQQAIHAARLGRKTDYHVIDLYNSWPSELFNFETFVVNPGRQGLKNISTRLKGRYLVYVSCDLKSLHTDLTNLLSIGWQIQGVEAFDLYPWTKHWEMVVALKKA